MQSHTDWQRPNLVYFFLCFVVIFEITFLICFRHNARLRIIKWDCLTGVYGGYLLWKDYGITVEYF